MIEIKLEAVRDDSDVCALDRSIVLLPSHE